MKGANIPQRYSSGAFRQDVEAKVREGHRTDVHEPKPGPNKAS